MATDDPFGLRRSLFVLTDPDVPSRDATDLAIAATRGGATHIVVRRPNDTPAEVHQIATMFSSINRGGATWRTLVHDRVDIAIATGAHGVVLPPDGIPADAAKSLLRGNDRMMGVSVHSESEARAARQQGTDFLIFGHVYETESHPGLPGRGLDALADIAAGSDVPVIAIGGITADQVDEVLAAGAAGIAVIRAISRADDPEAATRQLREALDAATYPHLS